MGTEGAARHLRSRAVTIKLRHYPGRLLPELITGETVPHRIRIPNHLILPFGSARKFDLNKIRLTSVGADGIYFTSDISCVYIDRAAKKPLTMEDYFDVFGSISPANLKGDDISEGLGFIHELVKACMPEATRHQFDFLTHYFDWIIERATKWGKTPYSEPLPMAAYNALLPVPEMQIYVHDPLEDSWSDYEPTNNFRVDFGFWTGTEIVAVEIDGHEPGGYARDVRRDRLLRRAHIDVIHILNTELQVHGRKVVETLLPTAMSEWTQINPPAIPPFIPF
jgi:hypothetical protein